MRVLYVINSFTWGGAEKLVFDLSLEIRKHVDWVGVAALYCHNDQTETYMCRQLNTNGIETYILNKTAGKDRIKSVLTIAAIIKKNKVDIVHGHCSVPMLISKFAGKLRRKRVVCTIHNTQGYSKSRERFTQNLVDAYVSIGAAAEDYMVTELGISKRRIHRIYNAIDVSKFIRSSPTPGFWLQYGGKENEKAILNVARVNGQKNQMCLLRAVNRCIKNGQKVHAYILGSYEESDPVYKSLKLYASNENIEQYVSFLGMHTDVNLFLSNSDCFVMTSWYEGLSVAFLEAVISGIPIITTDLPFVHELQMIGKCATIIQQDDSKGLAKLLGESKWEKPSQSTIDAFIDKFGMEKFVEKHLKLYQQVLQKNYS